MPPEDQDRTVLPLEEQHPFIYPLTDDLLKLVPSDEVKTLREWTAQQSNFPKLTDNYLRLFLHSNFGDQLQSQKTLEDYLKIRTKHPELFGNRDTKIQEIQQILDISEMTLLPAVTSKGYRILIYRLKDTNASKFDFVNAAKTFMIVNDVVLSETPLCPGFIVIFDMAGVCLSHLARVNFSALRVFMKYIQDCHPARLKAIYVINTVSFIDRILCLLKPFIKSELLSLIHFFGAVTSLEKHIPLESFPEDYGGKAPKMSTLHAQTRNWCEEKYHTWLLEEEKLRLIPGNKVVKEINCSFKQLVLD